MARAFGIVDVLIAGQSPKHRLPQKTDKGMPTIPPGARIGEDIARHGAEAEGVCVITASLDLDQTTDYTI